MAGTLVGQVTYTPYTFTTISGFANSGLVDGTNTAAHFSWPSKIAADAAGNLYVADQYDNAIRMLSVSGTNWVVKTIAGGTLGTNDGVGSAAQFKLPGGIAVGTNGAVYVADTQNNKIRQLTLTGTNWNVTTIAVTLSNETGFSGPCGLAFDGSGNMYVADQGNNEIRKMVQSATNWVVSTIAGYGTSLPGAVNGYPGELFFSSRCYFDIQWNGVCR